MQRERKYDAVRARVRAWRERQRANGRCRYDVHVSIETGQQIEALRTNWNMSPSEVIDRLLVEALGQYDDSVSKT